jgi:dolichol-phosphate mannosyltransferase
VLNGKDDFLATARGSDPQATPKGMSIIVPTFEEVENIPAFVGKVAPILHRHPSWELLVVDDGSPDGTADLAEAALFGLPGRVIRRKSRHRSLARSVVDGARQARHDCIAVLDADLSHDPEDLPRIAAPVLGEEADIAIGSRYGGIGKIAGWPLRRRILSAAGTLLAHSIAGAKDPLSGFFVCRRSILTDPSAPLRPRGYKILLEILGRTRGLRIAEVGVSFNDRSKGESKLGVRQEAEFIFQVLELLKDRLWAGMKIFSRFWARKVGRG